MKKYLNLSKIHHCYFNLGIPVTPSKGNQLGPLHVICSINSETNKIIGYIFTNSHPTLMDRFILLCKIHSNSNNIKAWNILPNGGVPWFPNFTRIFSETHCSIQLRLWREIREGDHTLLNFLMDIPLNYMRVLIHRQYLPTYAVERYVSEKVSEYNLTAS
jgi:hypothetical protein